MIRPRDPALVRADALRLGAEKQLGGCDACAAGYFTLARQHGATEEDIRQARLAAGDRAAQAEISRRAFLKTVAVATAGAAVAGAVSALPQLTAEAGAVSAATDGASVAWIQALRATASDGQPYRLIGIDAAGGMVGQIDPLQGIPLRSPDRRLIYVVSARADPTGATTVVAQYDAASGVPQRTIGGGTLALDTRTTANGRPDYDYQTPLLSPDGRMLVVLHRTRRVKPGTTKRALKYYPNDPAPKDRAYALPPYQAVPIVTGEIATTLGLEAFDLASGTTLPLLTLGMVAGEAPEAQVFFTPDGRLHLFTTGLSTGARAVSGVTTLAVAPDGLKVLARAQDDQPGHRLPNLGQVPRRDIRMVNRSLVAGELLAIAGPGPQVRLFDLAQLTLVQDLPFSVGQDARPIPFAAVFAPDGTQVHVVSPSAQTARTVDLIGRTVQPPVALPALLPQAGGRVAPSGGVESVALSPDGTILYVAATGNTGLLLLQVPGFQVRGSALPGWSVRSLWVAPDGQRLFALDGAGRLALLRGDGQLVGTVQLGATALDFVDMP